MRYYMAASLPPELSDFIEEIQDRWLGKPARWAPHVTFTVPRRLDEEDSEEELVDVLRMTTQLLSPFPIHYGGVTDDAGMEFIFLVVRRDVEFGRCHQLLFRAAEPYFRPPNTEERKFLHIPNPHINLAGYLPPDKMNDARAHFRGLGRLHKKANFTCDRINLLRRAEDEERWQTVTALNLG